MSEKKFWAVGGVFTDHHFSTLEPNTGECYGPFSTRDEAEKISAEKFRKNIDICWYNLFVTETCK